MAKKMEVREGDRIQVWLDVVRVSENALDEQVVTVRVPTLALAAGASRVTALLKDFDLEKTEKGSNWPD